LIEEDRIAVVHLIAQQRIAAAHAAERHEIRDAHQAEQQKMLAAHAAEYDKLKAEFELRIQKIYESIVLALRRKFVPSSPSQNWFPLSRIQSLGASMELASLNTDKHLKIERWRDCCRPRAPRLARFR